MRIQHNIMAMSAYRNYTNNVSAMKKNLEKLSSGYKINRAGDDAAGLAISEKMRAQITGLETAQKNAKDGISLVQTAEGALTEVHDMLNRMVELATMSANGTYDNTTDRAQLQKEMDQLNDEIDRIADSANFNGIKLLDGSMDAKGVVNGTGTPANDGSPVGFQPYTGTASGVSKIAQLGSTLGVNTKLHIGAAAGTHGTEFAVDLHEVKFDAKKGDQLSVTLGSGSTAVEIRLTAKNDISGGMNADDITKAIANGTNTDIDIEVKVGSGAYTAFDPANDKFQINGSDFTLSAANGRLSFKQDAVPDAQSKEVLGGMDVTVSSKINKPVVTGAASSAAPAVTGGSAGAKTTYTYDLDGITDVDAGKYKVTIGGRDFEIEVTDADASGYANATAVKAGLATKIAAAINADATKFGDGITDTSNYTVKASNGTVVFEASANAAASAGTAITGNFAITAADTRTGTTCAKGDYNVRTTDVKNVAFGGNEQLASTKISLDASKIVDGGAIIIGGTEYEFSAASADKDSTTKVYIGDLGPAKDGKNLTNTDLQEVARRITDAAAGNATWTVGTTKDGALTLVEKTNAAGKATGNDAAKGYLTGGLDLTTEKGIAATLGWRGVEAPAYAGKPGSSLTLQIGDTADQYNQLSVNIKDMHADMLGRAYKADGETLDTSVEGYNLTLDTISIASQGDAAKAVDVIKRAINQVSDLRGTLGATQNRLDHTINNLSVMTENIQDAESTIRDVDVAEEMMAYTKNNILIQSAQAMLAQANQVPQGVLQLLQ